VASQEGEAETLPERRTRTREKLRKLLADGKLEDREIEIEVTQSPSIEGMMIPMGGGEGMDYNFTEMLQDMLPKKKKRRRCPWPRRGGSSSRTSSTSSSTWTRS
jgi:ATP-dependent HslUV protease ATP-binding subunit HslU